MNARDARRLLEWFAAARRDLPWRGPWPRDPYLVLVSEVMLQQTQVERVREGYVRFVARFPDVAALAAATPDEAVAAFAGMGYYARARRLHAAAREVVARGAWPRSVAELRELPGVGAYTAAAVAAFAFGGSDPLVDGNIARVAARLLALELRAGSAELARQAGSLARELHAQVPRPDVYEALMELGATVCGPTAPRCPFCPLSASCLGRGAPGRFPLPRPERDAVSVRWAALWLQRDDGRVLLRRVPGGRLLAGLWLPPLADIRAQETAGGCASALAAELCFAGPLVAAGRVRHSITHHRIEVLAFRGDRSGTNVAEPTAGAAWVDPANPGLPTSSLLAKLTHLCSKPRPAAIDGRVRGRG